MASRKVLMGLAVCTSLLACQFACLKERTIKVTCGPTDAEAVSADFGSPNVAGISIGLLNSHQFAPGMILELVPPATGEKFGHGSVPYVVQVSDADFAPVQPEATINKVVSANFEVDADVDVKKAAEIANIDLKNKITNDTTLTVTNAQRKTLRNPIGLLNADPNAVARINHPDNRYVFISAVSYGDSVSLTYKANASSTSDVNVIKFADFKLDITWACSDVASINDAAQKAGSGKAAILFFYVPVTFRDGKVDTDSRSLDLTQYHLGNAEKAPPVGQ